MAPPSAGRCRRSTANPESRFEKLIIRGRPCFLKVLSTESDWIMRCTGNASYWEFRVWSAGRYHAAPRVIDHAMIGMALESTEGAPPAGHADGRAER